MKKIKNILRKGCLALDRVYDASSAFQRVLLGNEYARRSYSQYGEDMVLRAVFARYPATYHGFYVDIGAHHPMRFSNTRLFYEQEWSGICVDPLPDCSMLYARHRPRDKFIKAGVAEKEGEMTYFMFSEPAINTFSEKFARENAALVKEKETVKTYSLRRILTDHLPPGRKIDFLSVDAEGLDLEILHSNDWVRYRPSVVLIEETSHITLAELVKLDVAIFMEKQGYETFARTPGALFFMDTRSPGYEKSGYLLYAVDK
jgi:FkbM family methyltransferase